MATLYPLLEAMLNSPWHLPTVMATLYPLVVMDTLCQLSTWVVLLQVSTQYRLKWPSRANLIYSQMPRFLLQTPPTPVTRTVVMRLPPPTDTPLKWLSRDDQRSQNTFLATTQFSRALPSTNRNQQQPGITMIFTACVTTVDATGTPTWWSPCRGAGQACPPWRERLHVLSSRRRWSGSLKTIVTSTITWGSSGWSVSREAVGGAPLEPHPLNQQRYDREMGAVYVHDNFKHYWATRIRTDLLSQVDYNLYCIGQSSVTSILSWVMIYCRYTLLIMVLMRVVWRRRVISHRHLVGPAATPKAHM